MMRRILYFTVFLLLTFVTLVSCGGDETSTESVSIAESVEISEENSMSAEETSEVKEQEIKEMPEICSDKDEYVLGETIKIIYKNTDEKDWIGLYPKGAEPGTMNSLSWEYSVGEGTVSFYTRSFGIGEYGVYLCDNDGYTVLDSLFVLVKDGDTNNYGAKNAKIKCSVDNGITHTEISVVAGSDKELTYCFYWADGGSARLEQYTPIWEGKRKGDFTVSLNDGLFMPEGAEGIEISVVEGASESIRIAAPEELHIEGMTSIVSFEVLTDIHISEERPAHETHLRKALSEIIELAPESKAIFTCGDNTDRGRENQYDILNSIIDDFREKIPPIYFALGNHDLVFNSGYDEQLRLFKEKLGMEGAYYCKDIDGYRFIVLGSESSTVGEGVISSKQLDWFAELMEQTDSNKPTFVFLHQPLIDTVSGSLYSKDPKIQYWYGVSDAAERIREILKDHPNSILFTGHTHWTFESLQPVLWGKGSDVNFVNCAAVGYLWNDNDESEGGSEGYFVYVCDDKIILRGREFTENKWCGGAQFCLPLYN